MTTAPKPQIDERFHLLYRRLAKRFGLATIERHWERAQRAVAALAKEKAVQP